MPSAHPDPAILDRNLSALTRLAPGAARQIAGTPAREDVEFAVSEEGPVTALITGSGRRLASRRRPWTEARRFAEGVDVRAGAVLAVSGFGLGHHLESLSERVGKFGFLAVFEPDVPLLRAVLERVDCSIWLSRTPTVLVTDPGDTTALSAGLTSFQALAAMGVKLVDDHPASRVRLGDAAIERFGATVTEVVRALRTTITTTLVQVETTLRNTLMNLDRYATCPGIAELEGTERGKPAVLVAAGPSLRRNVDLLARPGVRDRVVIIAAQTVLKTLLARGVRPHYVTALDYHEISRRFYEGLSARDVAGVTLIAEPMANPAILDAFPGEIRLTRDERLDALLGPELRRDMGRLPGAATVAHLSYFLARHLGCDPAILIGQDLGFTDGQYYASGAAIHDVWAGELNPFRTLEMLEHERIVRSRHLLVRTEDQLGRPIYSDEQMHSYRVQFEEMFRADVERGLGIIDATEGGVRKAATEVIPLSKALERHAGAERDAGIGDQASGAPRSRGPVDPDRALARTRQRLELTRAQTEEVAAICRRTLDALERMRRHRGDTARINRLIPRIESLRDEVQALEPAYQLTQFLNQTGTLKRLRADRDISLERDLTPAARQARQIERDITNVAWLRDSTVHLGAMLDDALHALDTGEKITRDPPSTDADVEPGGEPGSAAGSAGPARVSVEERRVFAVIPVDPDRSSLGTRRDLARPIFRGRNALALTLDRLARCRRLAGAALVTAHPERARSLAGGVPGSLDVRIIEREPGLGSARRPALREMVRAARLFAPGCWRGAIAGMTVYDELFEPALFEEAMELTGASAAAIVGPDWAVIDPALVDETIERHLEDPERRTLTFSQAAPGLGTCVMARSLAADLRDQVPAAGPLASIAGVLGYHPSCARADPIACAACVGVPHAARDLGARVIADSPARARMIGEGLAALGDRASDAPVERSALALEGRTHLEHAPAPHHLILELCTGRLATGVRARWSRAEADAPERGPMPVDLARAIVEPLAHARPDLVLTLAGEGDPLHHPRWAEIVAMARDCGVSAVHVRTDLLVGDEAVDRLIGSGVDVVSVDVLAESRETYRALAGVDRFDALIARLDRLVERTRTGGEIRPPWIVPRITRCDAVYEQIESFYDRWLGRTGACVIDPLPAAQGHGRIEALPVPDRITRAQRVSTLRVDADGGVRMPGIEAPFRSASEEPIESVWRGVRRAGEAMGLPRLAPLAEVKGGPAGPGDRTRRAEGARDRARVA